MWIVIPGQTIGSLRLDYHPTSLNSDLHPVGLPAGQPRLQTAWMWTSLAEPPLFGVPRTKLFLLTSYGLLQRRFLRRRISLSAHPVDAPRRRLIRPNVLLRP